MNWSSSCLCEVSSSLSKTFLAIHGWDPFCCYSAGLAVITKKGASQSGEMVRGRTDGEKEEGERTTGTGRKRYTGSY
ncbi:hypothetical protein OUZ56_021855 [Daphnia magna]|uniref:Uncharacterized protein n=1 Tax=Daphnia magna TaxID=35525 RepID=A0ABR0AUN4_9CRUS|nr:hypothetical protein OUZ56_021855 [Daphnia magna]